MTPLAMEIEYSIINSAFVQAAKGMGMEHVAGERLHDLCDRLFRTRTPPYPIIKKRVVGNQTFFHLQCVNSHDRTAFRIEYHRSRGEAPFYIVNWVPPGQLRLDGNIYTTRAVGAEAQETHDGKCPQPSDQMLASLQAAIPTPATDRVWGVVEDNRIVEAIFFFSMHTSPNAPDARPPAPVCVRKGVRSRLLPRLYDSSGWLDMARFWSLAGLPDLRNLSPRLANAKSARLGMLPSEEGVIVLDDEVLARPEVWRQYPNLSVLQFTQSHDLKRLLDL